MKSISNKATEFLRQLSLFQDLTEKELEQISRIAKFEKIRKNEYLYREGERADKIYFLVKGIIKIGSHASDGREVIKHVLNPMAMFGELVLMGEEKRKDFAIAMNDEAVTYYIRAAQFHQLLQTNNRLAMKLLNFIGHRLRRTENRLESLIFKDARERIIDFLVDSATNQGRKIGYELLIKHCLTQQDIANITGTSRQTVTSVLNDLRKSNLIYFNRRSILIRDLGKLA